MNILKLQGSDALKILNGLSTNLIQQQKNPIYSCILTANGRFMFDYLLFHKDAEFLIAVNENFADSFVKYIKMFALDGNISLEKDQTYLAWNENEGEFEDPRPHLGFWNISSQKTDLTKFHKHRISLKIPDGFHDLTQKESIILDYGFDNLNAINYTKGCYLGQELIARTHHTGTIRKKVYGFKSNEFLQKGTEILQEGKVGKVLGGFEENYLANIRFENANFAKKFTCNGVEIEIK